jgi:hypothetical protein
LRIAAAEAAHHFFACRICQPVLFLLQPPIRQAAAPSSIDGIDFYFPVL